MYFNDDNMDTNIDEEFKGDRNLLTIIIETLLKYKLLFIGVIILEIIILIMIYFGNDKLINYLILTGDETINIYQGTDYIEIGYEAFNSNNDNLNDNVTVDSTLNINKIGEYEIIYKLDNLEKIRKINVVEKPDNYTYIELKSVNDKVDINLKIGEQYNEPGYEVHSTSNNLTEKVMVIGEVDASNKGTYTLIYTVVDLNNVTVSATRTVVVE